jgi:hypothetical protein
MSLLSKILHNNMKSRKAWEDLQKNFSVTDLSVLKLEQ